MHDTPPTTALVVGNPKYIGPSGDVYVASFTPLSLLPMDVGSGVAETIYRIYSSAHDSGWLTYSGSFTLAGLIDDTYYVEYTSTDNLGNVERTRTSKIILHTKRTMAEWAKAKIQQLKDDVAASDVDPYFKRLASSYLEIALREMDEAIEYIAVTDTIPANCHLSRAMVYVRRFSRLIDSYRRLPPDLAEEWKQ